MNKLEQILNKYMPIKGAFIQNSFITALEKLQATVINRSEIMRRAHVFFKQGAGSFSDSLKKSWEVEKLKVEENKIKYTLN